MKTITPRKKNVAAADWTHMRDSERNAATPNVRVTVSPSRPPQGALIESDEYEWITAVTLPGLIVSPREDQGAAVRNAPTTHPLLDAVLETEDGDATSPCQLPGLLKTTVDSRLPEFSRFDAACEAAQFDEYTDITAMQLPGRLVDLSLPEVESEERAIDRGLCATCIHREVCRFPKPTCGVWQCDEYA